jgi:ketosteroid isomerase-like protein
MTASAEELIAELCEALNSDNIERAAELTAPDAVQYGTVGGMDQDLVLRGRREIVDYWNDVGETWESLRYDPERVAASGDVILVFWRETARSARGELELQTNTATVFRVRDGKFVEIRGYMDRDEAVRAAGLDG